MSDFDNRLRQLEAEQANQRQEIQALRDATSTQIQRLDKEIQAVRDATSTQIERELERAWAAAYHELQGMLTDAQLTQVKLATFGMHKLTPHLPC